MTIDTLPIFPANHNQTTVDILPIIPADCSFHHVNLLLISLHHKSLRLDDKLILCLFWSVISDCSGVLMIGLGSDQIFFSWWMCSGITGGCVLFCYCRLDTYLKLKFLVLFCFFSFEVSDLKFEVFFSEKMQLSYLVL
ncbi:hypothetical protein Patl1_04437 [Pistacia atlantica]|uniref:Uncharacterized protein n=1 Tax=Pistacia atlantica TaxID=434234 RepID=A0ACC1BU69_9ROSI|nr:hypothetical protein Patl1_04437 [Pistacia atlantica]